MGRVKARCAGLVFFFIYFIMLPRLGGVGALFFVFRVCDEGCKYFETWERYREIFFSFVNPARVLASV